MKPFEESLSTLEKIVRQLENGDLPLEASLKLFEDGVKLSRECQERLNEAERRIEILLRDDAGKAVLQSADLEESPEVPAPKNKKRIVFDADDAPF